MLERNMLERCLKHSRKAFETWSKDVLNIVTSRVKHSRKEFEIVEGRLQHGPKGV
jgi:hypothetical protein